MSYGTILTTDIYFNRKTYKDKWQVERDLKEVNENISKVRQALVALAVTTEPNKVIHVEDDDSVIDVVVESANEHIDSLMELTTEKDNLELLLDEWDDCHDGAGKPRNCPETFKLPYIDGDFITDATDSEE